MNHTDQLGNLLEFDQEPKRIISTVPSQTELLAYFGLEDSVVGITKFCVHPEEWFRSKKRIGGTKNLNYELISQLNPDLIIANKEENDKSQIELLQKKFPVWISDIKRLSDACQMIINLGELLNCGNKALSLVNEIVLGFDSIKNEITTRPRVAYFIWNDPIMVAANETFINEMLQIAGFENIFAEKERYPIIAEEELKKLGPDFIFLSSEPFPFKEKHIQHFQNFCPNSKAVLVDGELFSWYGSRLLHSVNYFKKLRIDLL